MISTYISTEHSDPKDVQLLSPDILCAHVDITLETEFGTDSSGSNTMLTSTSLCDDPLFTQSLGEQDLSDGIVDLVRSGMVQVLSPSCQRKHPLHSVVTHLSQMEAPPICSVNLSARYSSEGLFMYPYISSNSFQNEGSSLAST